MSGKILQIVFDRSLVTDHHKREWTVFFNGAAPEDFGHAQTLRDFCSEHYLERGKEIGLWWLRLFEKKNAEGVSLHDLFKWDGYSALWFANPLFLYPESGIFPNLLLANRALELAADKQISEVLILGRQTALAETFKKNGIDCRMETHPPSMENTSGKPGGLYYLLLRLYRWYIKPRFAGANDAGKRGIDLILYSTLPHEWDPASPGSHRYFEHTLNEIESLSPEVECLPLVGGSPPAHIDDSEWVRFVEQIIQGKNGIYPPARHRFSDALRAYSWSGSMRKKVSYFLAGLPVDWAHIHGWNFSPMFRTEVSSSVRAISRTLLRYESLKESLKRCRPKCLLLKDEVYPSGKILIAAARSAGVRTVSLQHGNIYPGHWCYMMDPDSYGLARPPLPDAFGVYGEASLDLLISNGFPREILKIIGARRFNQLQGAVVSEKVKSFTHGEKPILLAGQMHPDMERIYNWVFEAAAEHAGQKFIIKPHPRDSAHFEELQQRCAKLTNTLYFDGPLREALPGALLAISGHSTVLLEAIWLGIPALSVQISNETPGDWQTQAGMLYVAGTRNEFLACLGKAIRGTLVSEQDRMRSKNYVECFLGKSKAESPSPLRELFL